MKRPLAIVTMAVIVASLAYVFLREPAAPAAQITVAPTEAAELTPVDIEAEDEPTCLTLEAYIAHPAITALHELQASWSGTRQSYEPFLNVDLKIVERRANSGDTAAMAVMATAATLEAVNEDPGNAVPLMLHGGKPDNSWLEDLSLEVGFALMHEDLTAKQLKALERAMQWHYRLAINGQISALSSYGKLYSRLNPDPVALGWIDRDRYEALSPILRTVFEPRRLYYDIGWRLFHPERYTPRYVDQLPEDDRANRQALLERLEAEFWDDLITLEPGSPEELQAIYDAARPVHRAVCPGVEDAYYNWLDEQRYRWPEPAAAE
ncbi:MAG: hypothetical protein AAGH76_16245 [Pseudomonadota bacterium]